MRLKNQLVTDDKDSENCGCSRMGISLFKFKLQGVYFIVYFSLSHFFNVILPDKYKTNHFLGIWQM
jgi:hypothetical protein